MTAYCTKDDMLARFDPRTLVQLTDRPADDAAPVATAVTESVLDQAIGDAGDLIDSYVAVVHPLPLVSIPPRLVKVACELALANLYRDAVPEHVSAARTAAVSWLKDVRDNKVRLFPDDTPEEGKGDGLVVLTGPPRRLSREKLRGGV